MMVDGTFSFNTDLIISPSYLAPTSSKLKSQNKLDVQQCIMSKEANLTMTAKCVAVSLKYQCFAISLARISCLDNILL
jgi:hypothetical protein